MSATSPVFMDLRQTPRDFSLVLGGPLYQLLRRGHLCGDGLEMLYRRIATISLFCWLPLLLLSALDGELLHGRAAVPFLLDVEVHVKFLVAVPLLIAAELVVHRLMRFVARQFLDRHLIAEPDIPRFEAAVASAFRLRNSVLAEVLLVTLVYAFGILVVWRHYTALSVATWYATPSGAGKQLSLSGIWYAYVSLPVAQFLLLRWYFRLFIWARFLWRVSHLSLTLVPTHPDRAGGLGFLSGTIDAFMPLALAHGALLAGQFANRIFYLGAELPQFKVEVIVLVVFVELLLLGPLMLFAPHLWQARQAGKREYGTLAQEYVREFDAKWLRGRAPPGEALMGSGDIQSLADMANSYEVVRGMSSTPVSKGALLQLAVATAAPVVPLALTMMPMEELLKKLLGILF
jgi:hypothetical protein